LLHTFNALHGNHKQIVLTADRKPREALDIVDWALGQHSHE
jgi:chromosomal replication initiation ATPase DnaA